MAKLEVLVSEQAEVIARHARMYQVVMEPSLAGDRSFYSRCMELLRISDSSSWAGKWIVRGIFLIGGVASAVAAFKTGFNK